MKLFFSPGACSMAPHIVARELGLNCEIQKVDLGAKTYAGGDFLKVNPKGQVPTLQTEKGEILTENAVIIQYLADQAPGKSLMPPVGNWERYRCQEWLNYVATEIHKGFSPLWSKDMPDAAKELTKKNLMTRFAFLNQVFTSQNYLMGTQFSVADAYLFTVLSWTKMLKMDMTPYPKVLAFMERVMTRPAVQEAMKAEGLLGQH